VIFVVVVYFLEIFVWPLWVAVRDPMSLLFAINDVPLGVDANLMSLVRFDFGIIIDGAVIISRIHRIFDFTQLGRVQSA